MTLPAGKARVGVRARIQSQAGARLRRSHTNQTVRDCEGCEDCEGLYKEDCVEGGR